MSERSKGNFSGKSTTDEDYEDYEPFSGDDD